MATWPGPVTPRLEGYLLAIRDDMVWRFEITVAEAEGRISRHFSRVDLLSAASENAIAHEGPAYWARLVYYGNDALWRSRAHGTPLVPRPWP